MNLSHIFKDMGSMLKKRSPEILTGIGIGGMITTTVLAVKATPKALTLIEDEKRAINHKIVEEAKADGVEKPTMVTQLKPFDVIKVTWQCYIPAVVMGVASTACLIGASSVSLRRNAALATAYTLSESALRDYKDKVIETIGEKKEQAVRDAIAKDKVEDNPVIAKEIIITEKGDTLCYDVLSGRYFKSDIEKINKAVNEVNHKMLFNDYVSLNDFYEELGLDGTKVGNDIGWTISQGLIEVAFSSQLASDGTPCIVLDYSVGPRYGYDQLI